MDVIEFCEEDWLGYNSFLRNSKSSGGILPEGLGEREREREFKFGYDGFLNGNEGEPVKLFKGKISLG